ncbi:MAG: protein-disulfide reductase [Sphingobacteriales bacterium]|nr:MAG: protein-disulfide reductase [Sphingobacteriales bacterium]
MRKYLLLLLLALTASFSGWSQIISDPTKWTFEVKDKGAGTYDVVFKLKLQAGWHIWSLEPGGDGLQIPPGFEFDKKTGLQLVGGVTESGNKHTGEMDGVDGKVSYFENAVTYTQRVKASGAPTISGKYTYQVCNDQMCLPPKTKKFTVSLPGADTTKKKDDTVAATVPVGADTLVFANGPPADTQAVGATPGSTASGTTPTASGTTSAPSGTDSGDTTESGGKGLLWLFLAAFGGGLLAVTTPCVYSMIPITVSFFTKRSKTRKEGIKNALLYSSSIIIIFTLLGVLISAVFGGNALNNLSTNWVANLIFFVIFVVFGISFLGAFEITLPSSWTNVTDSKANTKSFAGIFFMALTLVIVSFSCTGPIVGPLLVAAGKGGRVGPAVGMFGFSFGLALPFALFAIFPSALNKLAAGGGWLNQVKVFLGFIELMLALKFLSNADLARGWRLLDREVFISIWIVLSILLGLYLLGRLKLSHDDAPAKNVYGQDYVSLPKLFLAIASFAFAVYMIPGLWGAPLKGLSQFLPPMGTQDFVSGGGSASGTTVSGTGESGSGPAPVKYVEEMKIYEPEVVTKFGLRTYYDYDEALAAGKALGKPVMLDFTGINCVNCRKMESQVWSDPKVMEMLKKDFVIASLYCDYDKMALPKEQQRYSQILGSDIVTLGDYNEALQAEKFGANSQPFYFFVASDGTKLTQKGYGYDPSIPKFIAHLEGVKTTFAGR